jgi:hypothetical protein
VFNPFKSDPESPEIIAARQILAETESTYKVKVSDTERAFKLAESAHRGSKIANFRGNNLTTTMLNGAPVRGSQATVDANGSAYANSRLTVTRMVTLGVFSLAAPKRKTVDNRELYLNIISGNGTVKVIQCDPKTEGNSARQFAAKVTSWGATAQTAEQVNALAGVRDSAKQAKQDAKANTRERDAANAELYRLVEGRKAERKAVRATAKSGGKPAAVSQLKVAKAPTGRMRKVLKVGGVVLAWMIAWLLIAAVSPGAGAIAFLVGIVGLISWPFVARSRRFKQWRDRR